MVKPVLPTKDLETHFRIIVTFGILPQVEKGEVYIITLNGKQYLCEIEDIDGWTVVFKEVNLDA